MSPKDSLLLRRGLGRGEHGLEGGGEAVLRPPRDVVLEVVAFSPLRDPGDLIRVVLIAYDPDDLAAIVLKALVQYGLG